ncbi:protein FMC1 homolog [Lineus longissimus]|uniref:protein FMC1 homolog n=1 Tax=Lineus longissimus TaxID=88925 RepID=UPI002B4D345C
MAAPMRKNAALLRGIAKEFRHIYEKSGEVKEKPMYSFILDQFRNHDVTAQKICRGDKELEHMADTYLCYLYSSRRHSELIKTYKGTKRTTEESARSVGLTTSHAKWEKPSES